MINLDKNHFQQSLTKISSKHLLLTARTVDYKDIN